MKSWSYNQITKNAENQIKRCMENEREAKPDMQLLWWAQAQGVLTSWSALTMGWQNDGDRERLEALTKLPK